MCEVCHKTKPLNAHHFYSRSIRVVRWDIDNGFCLCVGCHVFSSKFSAHKTPAEFVEWAIDKRGITWYEDLKERKNSLIKLRDSDYEDLIKTIKLPIINMPKEVFIHTKKTCKKNSSIGLLATEGTLNTGVYNKFFDKNYNLIFPNISLQKNSVNKAIKFVKMGNVKAASKIIKPAINYLIKKKCKKIILGCTELPIAIFAFKSFKKVKTSKIFLDPNLILANAAMKKYRK